MRDGHAFLPVLTRDIVGGIVDSLPQFYRDSSLRTVRVRKLPVEAPAGFKQIGRIQAFLPDPPCTVGRMPGIIPGAVYCSISSATS